MRRCSDRQLAFALAPPSPLPGEEIVHQCIAQVLPPGVPSYVHRIERVVLGKNEVTADLRVWDGGLHTVHFWELKLEGPACLSMRWVGDAGWAPFGWDYRAKQWRRYPECVEMEHDHG